MSKTTVICVVSIINAYFIILILDLNIAFTWTYFLYYVLAYTFAIRQQSLMPTIRYHLLPNLLEQGGQVHSVENPTSSHFIFFHTHLERIQRFWFQMVRSFCLLLPYLEHEPISCSILVHNILWGFCSLIISMIFHHFILNWCDLKISSHAIFLNQYFLESVIHLNVLFLFNICLLFPVTNQLSQ